MDILRSLRTVSEASGPGVVDWDRAAGREGEYRLRIDRPHRGGASRVRGRRARRALPSPRRAAGIEFDVPDRIEVQNRHHWIDASVDTFRNVMAPIEAATTDSDNEGR